MASDWNLPTEDLDELLHALSEVDETARVISRPGRNGWLVPSVVATASFESSKTVLETVTSHGYRIAPAQGRYDAALDFDSDVAQVNIFLDTPGEHSVFAVCFMALAIDQHLSTTGGKGRIPGFRHAAPINEMARELQATTLQGLLRLFTPNGPAYTPGATALREAAEHWLNEAPFGQALPKDLVAETLTTLVLDQLGELPLSEMRRSAQPIKILTLQPDLLDVARALSPKAPVQARVRSSEVSRTRGR